MRTRILTVTSSAQVARNLADELQWDYAVTWCRSPDDIAVDAAVQFDLVVLDMSRNSDAGLRFVKQVRLEGDIPILAMCPAIESALKSAVLRAGADGILAPTVGSEELLARIEAHLRRPVFRRSGPLSNGGIVLDLDARRCEVQGEETALTRIEFDLLAAMISRRGATLTRAWLAKNVLHDRSRSAERNLDTHVSHLRRKLGTEGGEIETVRGTGFRLRAAPERASPDR